MDEIGEVKPDAKAHVEFFQKPVYSKEQSAKEKRPIFVSTDYVRVLIPGDSKTIVEKPVRRGDRQRYRLQYEAWKAGNTAGPSGTPLAALSFLSPTRIAEYEFAKVRTVEQLADISDDNTNNFGIGTRDEVRRAKDYLETMKGNAPVAKLQAENEELSKRLAALEQMLSTASVQPAEEAEGEQPKRRTRKSTTEAAAE